MRLKQELTLQNSSPVAPVFRSISKPDDNYATTLQSSSQKGAAASESKLAPVNPGNADNCASENLKLSYIILDEHISNIDAFRLLGRVVGNVTNPLENYAPTQVISGAEIPELRILSSASTSTPAPGLMRQSSNSSEVSIISSTGTIVDDQLWLDIDPSLLIFRNLPYVVGESTSATLSHFSQYTKKSESLLTSLLGLSIQSSRTSCKEFKLESKLIRTVSLTQHNLVWTQLLKTYKRDMMSAVRKCGGTMFLVIGVKVARDAEVEVNVAAEKGLGGKLEVDAGAFIGVKDLGTGRIIGGKGGVVGVGSMEWGKSSGVQRREKVLGDRAFAIEYREVKLKTKLAMGKQAEKQNRKEGIKNERHIQENEAVAVGMGGHECGNDINDQNELFRIQREKNELLEQQLKQQAEALEALKSQQAIMAQAFLQGQNQHGFTSLPPPAPPPPPRGKPFSIRGLFRRQGPPASSSAPLAYGSPAGGAPVPGPMVPDPYTPIPVGLAPPPVAPPQFVPAPPQFMPAPPQLIPHRLSPGPPRFFPHRLTPGPPQYTPGPPEYTPGPPIIPVQTPAPPTFEEQLDTDLCDDDYDLELGDEVYVQELDALC